MSTPGRCKKRPLSIEGSPATRTAVGDNSSRPLKRSHLHGSDTGTGACELDAAVSDGVLVAPLTVGDSDSSADPLVPAAVVQHVSAVNAADSECARRQVGELRDRLKRDVMGSTFALYPADRGVRMSQALREASIQTDVVYMRSVVAFGEFLHCTLEAAGGTDVCFC